MNKGTASKSMFNHFKKDVDFKVESGNLALQAGKASLTHGGHNRQQILMSLDTFEDFCMRAETLKAPIIRTYFRKMNRIAIGFIKDSEADNVRQLMSVQVANENQRLQLQNALADALASKRAERSRALVDGFDNVNLTYVMHMMTFEDGSILIKIGMTRARTGIKKRLEGVCRDFGVNATVMDVYPCELNYDFEQDVHAHGKVAPYVYTELVNNTRKSKEVFRLPNPDLYEGVKRMMQMEVSKYEKVDIRERELIVREKHICMEENKLAVLASIPEKDRMEAIKLMYAPAPTFTQQPSDEITSTETDAEGSEGDMTTVTNFSQNLTGPIVRTFMPNDLSTCVGEYGGITEATRDVKEATFSQIKTSAENRTVYLGRRWQLVARDEQDKHVPVLETLAHQVRKTGFVAVMADDGASIVNVYANMARFAEFAKVSAAAVTLALKNNTKTGKRGPKMTIKMWDELDKSMQDEWLVDHDLPTRQASSRCKAVYRTCVADQSVLMFESQEILRVKTGVTTKTVKASHKTQSVHNGGFRYSYLKPDHA
jgi:hypothetical protein